MANRSTTPPVILSPSVSGPVDAYELHNPVMDVEHNIGPSNTEPGDLIVTTERATQPVSSTALTGKVRNMASQLEAQSSRDRYKRPTTASRNAQRSPAREARKLQRPRKSPSTSFDTSNLDSSFSSGTGSSKTMQGPIESPNRPRSSSKSTHTSSRPLFGEITADGKWNGNFDLVGDYGSFPKSERVRRGSEGSLALIHGRSQSHQEISTSLLRAPAKQKLNHKRSRSDIDALKQTATPSMPNLNAHHTHALYPTPPDSGNRAPRTASRIPISSRRKSSDSAASSNGFSRAPSAMSNPPSRRKQERSPSRTTVAKGKENSGAISRSRYHPPPLPITPNNQSLSAKIVAPLPKTSPPLRSSRPRQPVSAATTSASRARAAERYQPSSLSPRDGRRPSEQWLGKPYDPQKERSRRRIPELDKIDFEERRARIQEAITQSLKSSESYESMKRSQSRSQSRSVSSRAPSGPAANEQGQAHREIDSYAREDTFLRGDDDAARETPRAAGGMPFTSDDRSRGLSVDTASLPASARIEQEPWTGLTERTLFEDESPVLGQNRASSPEADTAESPILLTPARYQPPSKAAAQTPDNSAPRGPGDQFSSPTAVRKPTRTGDRSGSPASGTHSEFPEENASAQHSPSDPRNQWALGNGLSRDHGSIRIMLDDDPGIAHHLLEPWSYEGIDPRSNDDFASDDASPESPYHGHTAAANGHIEAPIDEHQESCEVTPRKTHSKHDALKSSEFQPSPASDANYTPVDADEDIARALHQYHSTGSLTADMIEQMQDRVVDLHRLSANGGSDANMIQSLLASIMDARMPEDHAHSRGQQQMSQSDAYDAPMVTPDTPPTGAGFEPGTVIVYGTQQNDSLPEDDDFETKIRRADEEWERQHHGSSFFAKDNQNGHEQRPPPPPKDFGYTPRSSTGPGSAAFATDLTETDLRISTSSQPNSVDIPKVDASSDELASDRLVASPMAILAPPPPSGPPPPPPEDPVSLAPFALPDFASGKAYSDRTSSEMSPRFHRSWAASGSSRPSVDSQRMPQQLPASQSTASFAESIPKSSFDTGNDSQARIMMTIPPGPEQKRLLKRRHIIKELLDTENSYHQDLKIIEDIYKATCTPELVAPEDKKVLFGNCDEIERFALRFYDDLRRASAQVYVPAKQHRWTSKRNSFSTTQSDGTTQTTNTDGVDDDRDRTTTIGRTFLMNFALMEKVYGFYLKNHDAANQRLSAIQNVTTVKCWLDECHANASDITSAWDLDSLLVKPTQRVAKYPMLLQQLLETTPADHPDHEDLKAAAKDSISMLTRINEAKKRADLVEQIISRKSRKESDVRSGLAKAFGRRTEKLKERVGIAEAFQDPEFDELAHKFGGHFIRLQICMRDVQDYMQRTDKAVELMNSYAEAIELVMDVHDHQLTEVVSKWHKYGQTVRDLTFVAFGEHKVDVQKRVLAPMIQCIKLHEGPQSAISKRKKRIVDFAKCKSEERRGQKPDKRTQDASDAYVALNDALKDELPKLYGLTAKLVQTCLQCFLDIQLKWQSTWERKLRPILEAGDIPSSIQQIEPAFRPDFVEIEKQLHQLSICNGTLKIEAANFLSPTTTLLDSSEQLSAGHRRPSTVDSSNRTLSLGSESSTAVQMRRHSGARTPGGDAQQYIHRVRSNSSMSARVAVPAQTPGSTASASRPWSNLNTPNSSFSASRPSTAHPPSASHSISNFPRQSYEIPRNSRPTSDATYFTARPDPQDVRFSGLFHSALPPEVAGSPQQPQSPTRTAPGDMHVLFVCASLFEFSIDRTRKEAGYPYLQYVQGEVFDVVAQKGELWLAKNQDDQTNELGWIWEQHFIILSAES